MRHAANFLLIVVLLFFSKTTCMFPDNSIHNGYVPKQIKNWEITDSIFDLPVVGHNLTEKEKQIFSQIWNQSESLLYNQKSIAKLFIDTCIDSSFPFTQTNRNPCYFWDTDRGNIFLIFTQKQRKRQINNPLKNNEHIITISLDSFCKISDEQEEIIQNSIYEIIKVPIGCELLRILISKHIANSAPKITLVSTNDSIKCSEILLLPTSGTKYNNSCYQNEKLFFLPRIMHGMQSLVSYYDHVMDIWNIGNEVVNISTLLFYELAQMLYINVDQLNKQNIIQKRFEGIFQNEQNNKQPINDEDNDSDIGHDTLETLIITVDNNQSYAESTSEVLEMMFENDEEYKVMFGLSQDGLNYISSAAYTASMYGFIRCCNIEYIHDEYRSQIAAKFMLKYGDTDIWEYYFSKNFKSATPKFGEGNYMYSDKKNITPHPSI